MFLDLFFYCHDGRGERDFLAMRKGWQGKRDINGEKLKMLLKICKRLSRHIDNILTDEEILHLLQEVEKPH